MNSETLRDRSGSCALIVIIYDEQIYVANVGDSRAIISKSHGSLVDQLSRDHKPSDEKEQMRIFEAGGKVYQNKNTNIVDQHGRKIVPPVRVLPGRLSVSRTFGDCSAKMEKYGGMAGCIIAIPEINVYAVNSEIDYIILGSDGIFDHLSNEQIC